SIKSLGSRRSSIKREKRNSIESKQYVDDDESILYDDDYDDTNSLMDDDTDESLFEPINQISSASVASTSLGKIKSNNYSTFDNHGIDEKVIFPSLIDGTEMDFPEDQEPPYAGLTYESFLTPKYVKISRRNKQSPKILNNLFLAQELNVGEDSLNSSDSELDDTELDVEDFSHDEEVEGDIRREIFVMEFSKDGKYLAAAGRDAVIRIWKVISSPLGRMEFNQQERESGTPLRSNKRDYVFDPAPVFHRQPVREFRGHSSSILSLAWSKNNFLITGSMDRTAKLWHVDRDQCLQTFQHEDFVTAVKFHPHDDRFFLSGSLDNEVRLWSILENTISYSKNLGDGMLITALELSPDGVHCFVGGFNGYLYILETKGLFEVFHVEIKERSIVHPFNANRNGNKITGIKVFDNPLSPTLHNPSAVERWTVLVTTNDSKIRMITTTQKKLITRFRGLTNNSSSIVADSSEDQKYVISGSEDHYCYVWENNNSIINNKLKQSLKEFVIDGKQHISDFHHKHEKYSKFIALNKFFNKFLDDGEGDVKHDFIANENNSYSSFHAHHSKCNIAIFAPEATKRNLALSDDLVYDLKKRGDACKFDPSKCFICNGKEMKMEHQVQNGDIIVTSDQFGLIRVFRQDSASLYRRKFIELYKKGQLKNNTSDVQSLNLPERSLSLRRGISLRDRSSSRFRESSLSPTRVNDSSISIKNMLTSKMHNPSAPSTPLSDSSFVGSSASARQIPSGSLMAYKPSNSLTGGRNHVFAQTAVPLHIDHDNVVDSSGSGSDVTLGVQNNASTSKVSSTEDITTVEDVSLHHKPQVPRIVLPNEERGADFHAQLQDLKINSHTETRGRSK
ncbi:hypothetical protein G210_5014, partial [Candida maltosa Xu316]